MVVVEALVMGRRDVARGGRGVGFRHWCSRWCVDDFGGLVVVVVVFAFAFSSIALVHSRFCSHLRFVSARPSTVTVVKRQPPGSKKRKPDAGKGKKASTPAKVRRTPSDSCPCYITASDTIWWLFSDGRVARKSQPSL